MSKIIVAYNGKFVIGNNMGKVPWHIKEDLKFFKDTTVGHVCIMGRVTWESIPEKYRPLPGRINVVLSRNKIDVPENVIVSDSLDGAINFSKEKFPDKEIFVTGGAKVYNAAIEQRLVEKVIASEVKNYLDVEGAAFFPNLKELGWKYTKIKEFDDFDVVEYVP